MAIISISRGTKSGGEILARCLADLDARGEFAAPFDRAADLLTQLVMLGEPIEVVG